MRGRCIEDILHGKWFMTSCASVAQVGQSKGLLILRLSVRFRLNPENSNPHGFELNRPSIKDSKLLL